jgi:hypothetical protein
LTADGLKMTGQRGVVMTVSSYVVFDGPFSEPDQWGDEFPVWFVFVADDDGEPTGKTYKVFSFDKALSLAERIAADRKLELEVEALRA